MHGLPILAAAAAVAFAGVGMALRAQQPSPTFRSGVDILNLDVSVLDKARRPVRGLTADDFTVLVEGKPRPVVAFSAIEVPSRPAVSHTASWLNTVPFDVSTNDITPDGRALVIVFDHSIEFDHLDRARKAAIAAVDALGPNDVAAIAFTDAITDVNTVQGFTSDKVRLREVIGRPITYAPTLVDRGDHPENIAPTASCYCNACAFDRIGRIAEGLLNVTGRRKTVLFIGFETADPFPNVAEPEHAKDPCVAQVIQIRQVMEERLSRANLTVHVIDPSGGQPLNTEIARPPGFVIRPPDERLSNPRFKRAQFLRSFADITRGAFVSEDNTLERAVPAIIDETSTYYLLAVQVAPEEGQKLPSRLQVTVRDKTLLVQARKAYRSGDSSAGVETSARDRSLVEALSSDLMLGGQPLTMAAMPFASPRGGTPKVAVVMRVEQPKTDPAVPIADAPPARKDTFEGVIVAFDRSGKIVASRKQTGTVPWRPGDTAPPPYEVFTGLDLAPGRYEIRAAFESRGTRSSVYGFVDVPAFDNAPFSLSPIALALHPPPLSAPREEFSDFLPVVPTAQRRFANTDIVDAFVRIHHTGPNPPATSLAVRVVDADDRTVVEEQRDQVDDDNTIELPLDRLPAGEYLLTVTANAGAERAVQQLRFTVN
jgi:VWFA-related protein